VQQIDDSEFSASTTEKPSGGQRLALLTFAILFSMNLLDYMDRNVLSAVLPQLKMPLDKGGLGLSNAQSGKLATVFLVTYSVFGLVMGWAGDRYRRTLLLGAGVGVWGIATVGSGFARNYDEIWYARSLLGLGEATYGILAPTILLDLFSRQQRARLMSGFYLAMPVGSALGIVLGTSLAPRYGWQMAFFVVGGPAVAAALLAFLLPEPRRGLSEGVDEARLAAHERAGATKADYVDLMVNSSYTYSVFGMAAYTFAIGGMLIWIPTFLVNTRGIPQTRMGSILAPITALAAILGMTLGGWIADRWSKTNPRALFIVPGIAMLGAIPFVLLGLFAKSEPLIYLGIFLAETLMFVNTGPCNAIIANVVTPNLRAAAYAAAIFSVHFLGDIWSPWLIGSMADTFGKPDAMATPFGHAFAAIGAIPTHRPGEPPGVNENLLAGLVIVVPAIALAGVVLLAGARHLPREMALMLAKLKSVPRPAPSTPSAVSTTQES
jgi:MFS transporter, Spinster family, sphingosine-1-phosphate transporter